MRFYLYSLQLLKLLPLNKCRDGKCFIEVVVLITSEIKFQRRVTEEEEENQDNV